MKAEKRPLLKIILCSLAVLVLVAIFCVCFFPTFHFKVDNDVVSYSSDAYEKFGFGFNRYGKIAAGYLPKYEDIIEGSTDIDFLYSGGHYYSKTVDVIVNVKYDESAYLSKKSEIISMGEDFGEDCHIGETESRYHRLIDKRKKANGEYVYYIISCCDKDRIITYSVMFDLEDHTDFSSLSIHSHPYDNFFRDFHIECMPSE